MSLSEPYSVEPTIPSRRRQSKAHMQSASRSTLGSAEESYSVQAAQAEALMDIAEELHMIRISMGALVDELRATRKGTA